MLYVNGIALGTIELKRSKVAVSEGIRQTIGNQKPEFIRPFFTTVQLVMAGNDVEGLRYGVIDTPEKYWLAWQEDGDIEEPLDRALTQLCSKERLLELIHDFMVFDAGVKKTCRHNQYFGVKAAQARVAKREGGIIWHTQGSGKSPDDGLAGQVDPGAPDRRPGAPDHRPHRTRRADRGRLQRRQRGDLPHDERRRPARHPQPERRRG